MKGGMWVHVSQLHFRSQSANVCIRQAHMSDECTGSLLPSAEIKERAVNIRGAHPGVTHNGTVS